MKLTRHASRRLAAAAITCTAILVPTAALAAAGSAATAGAPASGARPACPVTAYVVNTGSDTVTPINIATGKAGKAIKVGSAPDAIVVTPDGKTAYVANSGSDTVTPINAATGKAGRPSKSVATRGPSRSRRNYPASWAAPRRGNTWAVNSCHTRPGCRGKDATGNGPAQSQRQERPIQERPS
jgi:YVTN family beta-propeller protein